MNHTTNYQLSQWAASDPVQRTDFNADNAKIDAALGAIPKIVTGTYTGDGAAERFLDLGFTPKAVYICTAYGAAFVSNSSSTQYLGGLIVTDGPLEASGMIYGQVAEGGVQLYHKKINDRAHSTNRENTKYHYLALSW